jgi:hypothetical protein
MPRKIGKIEADNPSLKKLGNHIAVGSLFPPESELYKLTKEFRDLPSLPDRFNAAFIQHGWIYVEFACGWEAAEKALTAKKDGAEQSAIDEYLASSLFAIEPIKWQTLKVLGGGLADPKYPARASVVERLFEAYEGKDYLVAVPLVLMLVDGFGVSATGTKSIFADLDSLDELFQSSESIAGHPSALKALLVHLRKGQRGYSEDPISIPFRNGILHGTRLNYANPVTAAKAINLLAAVVEWARDVAPEPKDDIARREWNRKFLSANLTKLNPTTPQRALEMFQFALEDRRATDLVALTDYHPVITLLSEKIKHWRELDSVSIAIETLDSWTVFGTSSDTEQHARCSGRLTVILEDGTIRSTECTLYASRSAELAKAQLPSVWQIYLGLFGAIQRLINGSSG